MNHYLNNQRLLPLYIINFAGIAYHQRKALYIIIAEDWYTAKPWWYTVLWTDEIQCAKHIDDIPPAPQWIKKSRSEERDFLAPTVGFEPTTDRLTGDRGKIPLFPMLPNSPILLGLLDSVGIMEIEIFHYSHTLQKNEEQNPVRKPLSIFAPETCDIFCFSRRLQLYYYCESVFIV